MEYRESGRIAGTIGEIVSVLTEKKVEDIFKSYLKKTISIRDTFVRKEMKENFYHGILLGILGIKEEWGVFSNQKTGEGYSDILIETENSETAILIEVKYAGDGKLANS